MGTAATDGGASVGAGEVGAGGSAGVATGAVGADMARPSLSRHPTTGSEGVSSTASASADVREVRRGVVRRGRIALSGGPERGVVPETRESSSLSSAGPVHALASLQAPSMAHTATRAPMAQLAARARRETPTYHAYTSIGLAQRLARRGNSPSMAS